MKKRDAKWWRDYRVRRARKRQQEQPEAPQPPVQPPATPAQQLRPTPQQARHLAQPPAPPVVVGGQPSVATPAILTPPRRRRMKSDQEIRAYIINAMQQYGRTPKALLHVLTGYITSLQDLMKRDHEDQIADRACAHRHPGKLAQGLYCKMCHDAEMAARFGGMPPEFANAGATTGNQELEFPGDKEEAGVGLSDDEEDDLDLINIAVPPPPKED